MKSDQLGSANCLIPARFAAVFYNLAKPGEGVRDVLVLDVREHYGRPTPHDQRTHHYSTGAAYTYWHNGFPQVEALWDEPEGGSGFFSKAERRNALREFGKIDTAIWARRMLAEPLLGWDGDVKELRTLRRKIDSGQTSIRSGGTEAWLPRRARTMRVGHQPAPFP